MHIQRLFTHGLLTKKMYDEWVRQRNYGFARGLEESQLIQRSARIMPLLFCLLVIVSILYSQQLSQPLSTINSVPKGVMLLIQYLLYSAVVGTALLWRTRINWEKSDYPHLQLIEDCMKLQDILKTLITPGDIKLIEGIKGFKNKVNPNHINLCPVAEYAHNDMKEVFRRIMYGRIDPHDKDTKEIHRILSSFGFINEPWDKYLEKLRN